MGLRDVYVCKQYRGLWDLPFYSLHDIISVKPLTYNEVNFQPFWLSRYTTMAFNINVFPTPHFPSIEKQLQFFLSDNFPIKLVIEDIVSSLPNTSCTLFIITVYFSLLLIAYSVRAEYAPLTNVLFT